MGNEIEMKIANAAARQWNSAEPKTLEEAMNKTGKSEIASVIGIIKTLGLDDSIAQKLIGTLDEKGKPIGDGIIYTQESIPQDIAEQFKDGLEGSGKYKKILDILSTVHDNWVKNNQDNFLKPGRNRERQFVPLEMLDWDEVVNDLVFLKPILEAAGMEVEPEALKREFEIRQKEYMIDNELYSHEDLVDHLMKGSEAYGTLEALETKNGGNIDSLLQQQEIAETMAGQMEKRGVIAKSREDLSKEILESESPELDDMLGKYTNEKGSYEVVTRRDVLNAKIHGKTIPELTGIGSGYDREMAELQVYRRREVSVGEFADVDKTAELVTTEVKGIRALFEKLKNLFKGKGEK